MKWNPNIRITRMHDYIILAMKLINFNEAFMERFSWLLTWVFLFYFHKKNNNNDIE